MVITPISAAWLITWHRVVARGNSAPLRPVPLSPLRQEGVRQRAGGIGHPSDAYLQAVLD